jgi:hypothetical protein
MGAAVVVLSLPVDLFFQQIVAYPPLPSTKFSSTTPSATTFAPVDGNITMNGTRLLRPPIGLSSFGQSLFLSNGSMPELKGVCPTSNCTWQPFETLGVCSQCDDIGASLSFGCMDAPLDWNSRGCLSANNTYPFVPQCGYFLNETTESPVLMSGYTVDSSGAPGEALGMRFMPLVDPISRAPYFGSGTVNFNNISSPLADLIIASSPDGPSGAYRNQTPTAKECVFYWCVQQLHTSYSSGRLWENVTQTWQMDTDPGYPWRDAISATGRRTHSYNTNFTLRLPARAHGDPDQTFFVSNVTAFQVLQVWDLVAPSYVTSLGPNSPQFLRWLNSGLTGEPTVEMFPNSDNPWLPPNDISAYAANFAKALTYVIRNSPKEVNGLVMVNGTAFETLVQIRWAWLSLPLTLLGSSLIFLVALVVRSSLEYDEVGIWKTSVLAVLFNGFGDDVPIPVGPRGRMGEISSVARKMMVRLAPE